MCRTPVPGVPAAGSGDAIALLSGSSIDSTDAALQEPLEEVLRGLRQLNLLRVAAADVVLSDMLTVLRCASCATQSGDVSGFEGSPLANTAKNLAGAGNFSSSSEQRRRERVEDGQQQPMHRRRQRRQQPGLLADQPGTAARAGLLQQRAAAAAGSASPAARYLGSPTALARARPPASTLPRPRGGWQPRAVAQLSQPRGEVACLAYCWGPAPPPAARAAKPPGAELLVPSYFFPATGWE